MTSPLPVGEGLATEDDGTLIVLVGDQLLVFPGEDCQGPQCVAASGRRGQRCRGSAQNGQYDGYREIFVPGADAYVDALAPCTPDECFIQQRCPKHLDSSVPDAVEPEWEAFDPERHADLLKSVGPCWTPEGVRPDPREPSYISLPATEVPQAPTNPRPTTPVPIDPPQVREAVPTALYSYYDADDQPLYIGISGSLRGRERSHLKSSSWMDFVARSSVQRFPSREEAEASEREAIKAERPLFNVVHNEGPDGARRLVEYLVAHGRTDLLAPAVSRG
ncbi:MAG: hypothetical protein JWO67_4047 [Streptosporangiaceae bacterium]|nr:hypothetical protein [Streptosporangiaceae bacterium]